MAPMKRLHVASHSRLWFMTRPSGSQAKMATEWLPLKINPSEDDVFGRMSFWRYRVYLNSGADFS